MNALEEAGEQTLCCVQIYFFILFVAFGMLFITGRKYYLFFFFLKCNLTLLLSSFSYKEQVGINSLNLFFQLRPNE